MATGHGNDPSSHMTCLFLDWDGTLATTDTLARIARIGYDHQGQKYDAKQPEDEDEFLGIYPPGYETSSSSSSNPLQTKGVPGPTAPTIAAEPTSSAPGRPSWPAISNAYMADLNHFTKRENRKKRERKPNSSAELSDTSLAEILSFQQRTREIEERSTRRLEKWGIWKGITDYEIDAAAKDAIDSGEIALRNGWEDAIRQAVEPSSSSASGGQNNGTSHQGKAAIVSVGWSIRFIRQCLAQGEKHDKQKSSGVTASMDIAANEIDGATGHMSRYFDEVKSPNPRRNLARSGGIWTGEDKWRIVREFVRTAAAADAQGTDTDSNNIDSRTQSSSSSNNSGGGKKGGRKIKSIYVGDSTGDLECLVGCDVGICVRDVEGQDESKILRSSQRSLAETCDRLGIHVKWVGHWRKDGNGGAPSGDGNGTGGGGDDVDDIIPELEAKMLAKGKILWWARDFNEIVQSGILD
ncbi:hypothetical protein L228DRAFT_237539 [Xylona heveae TC161]|uniref:HAD-like protein n=1 Tax=Xylona heveae (strain CBS 132557 / TC161) TaxID=1328760 RepID=A0A165IAJ3_XYLHT|nr:hypothetical protein L228DRAFT_237539 [Xylona heveae TC161]KZF24625.1 hypothetical protein L228DRAFT_237539 [Xylona heveae TC161]